MIGKASFSYSTFEKPLKNRQKQLRNEEKNK